MGIRVSARRAPSSVAGFTSDLDLVLVLEEALQSLADRYLIANNKNADRGQTPDALPTSGDTGRPANKRRHGRAIRRAQRFARLTRALSVAMPVFAYI